MPGMITVIWILIWVELGEPHVGLPLRLASPILDTPYSIQ
jgi:hypothetical protein